MRLSNIILLSISSLTAKLFLCAEIIYTSDLVTVSDFVGSGFSGYIDGSGNQTMFEPRVGKYSFSMTKDNNDNILFIDGSNSDRIRFVSKNGVISTLNIVNTDFKYNLIAAGTSGLPFLLTTPKTGWPTYPSIGQIINNNSISNIKIDQNLAKDIETSYGMCVDSKNNLYISASYKHKILRVSPEGKTEVFAGSGNNGNIDGNGLFCSFSFPFQITCDSSDNIYVWDSGNQLVRKIDPAKNVTTFCGKKGSVYNNDGTKETATFGYGSVDGLCFGSLGKIYISSGSYIRSIDQNGNVCTVAGWIENGYKNGSGKDARFKDTSAIVSIGNSLLVAETGFPRIRKITIGQASSKIPFSKLNIKLSAGITINGTVGKKYSIESSSNGGKQWIVLTELDLTKSPYTWYDENSVGTNNLYRVFESP